MKKRRKTMLTLVAILILAIAGYDIIGQVRENRLTKQAKEDAAEPVYVTAVSDVAAFQYTDGSDTLSFIKEEDAWICESDKKLDLEESTIEEMASSFGTVQAERVLEAPDALADYGLEEPVYTIKLSDSSGNTTTLYLGNETTSGCYAATGDKTQVYIVSSGVVNAMEWNVDTLVHVEETEEVE